MSVVRVLTICILMFTFSLSAHARLKENPSESCKNLDMTSAEAVLECLKDDGKYEHRIRHRLDAGVKCHHIQDLVLNRYIVSTDPTLEKHLRTKDQREALPRPSCNVIAQIVNTVSGSPPVWGSCLGYAEADDKFLNFKNCVVGFNQGVRRNKTPEIAKREISAFTCDRVLKTYNSAHQYINVAHFPEQGKHGVYTPKGYEPPSCDQINAWLEDLKSEKIVHEEKVAEESKILRQKRIEGREAEKALRAEKAAEAQARAKRTREVFAEMDKSYDFSEQTQNTLETVNKMEHPTSTIEGTHIRRALIQKIQKLVPEENVSLMGMDGETRHTVGGFKSYFTNVPSAPKIFYGVDSIDIQNCDISDGEALCNYTATFFTNVDNSGVTNQQRAGLDTLYKLSGAGPRVAKFENAFKHDGTQWKAILNANQEKLLLPPPPPKRSTSDNDTMCDVLTIMGAGVC